MGDQAQTYCTEQFLHKPIFLDTGFALAHECRAVNVIRSNIKSCDKIFLHSGYHAMDLYVRESDLQREVISRFPDYKAHSVKQKSLDFTDTTLNIPYRQISRNNFLVGVLPSTDHKLSSGVDWFSRKLMLFMTQRARCWRVSMITICPNISTRTITTS